MNECIEDNEKMGRGKLFILRNVCHLCSPPMGGHLGYNWPRHSLAVNEFGQTKAPQMMVVIYASVISGQVHFQ